MGLQNQSQVPSYTQMLVNLGLQLKCSSKPSFFPQEKLIKLKKLLSPHWKGHTVTSVLLEINYSNLNLTAFHLRYSTMKSSSLKPLLCIIRLKTGSWWTRLIHLETRISGVLLTEVIMGQSSCVQVCLCDYGINMIKLIDQCFLDLQPLIQSKASGFCPTLWRQCCHWSSGALHYFFPLSIEEHSWPNRYFYWLFM